MQLNKIKIEAGTMSLEEELATENKFITDLLSVVAFPDRYDEECTDDDPNESVKKPKLLDDKIPRANSIAELKAKLSAIQSKKQQTYKEKLKKKDIKNQVKRKTKKAERSAVNRFVKTNGTEQVIKKDPAVTDLGLSKQPKPVYNNDGKMVFSKFDFSGLGTTKKDKDIKDPKKILENLNKQKEKLKKLEAEGDANKAQEIKDKTVWKNAIAKAEGAKVRDDPVLLKKSVKKVEQRKKASKKKWDARLENVKNAKAEKQKKRKENIDKRKQSNKTTKLKKAAKKGKIIPGF